MWRSGGEVSCPKGHLAEEGKASEERQRCSSASLSKGRLKTCPWRSQGGLAALRLLASSDVWQREPPVDEEQPVAPLA